jgi:hypothetical protein
MYRWTDKAGSTHFSDQPGDPSAQRLAPEDMPPVTETEQVPAANPVPQKTFLPGAIMVKGQLFFDGRPFSDVTAAAALIRLYSRELKQWITPDYAYDAASGTFQLTGIAAGSYSGEVKVDADRSNPDQYPGDYKGRFNFNAVPPSRVVVTVDMERIMHLTSPEDNNVPLADWGAVCSNKIEFETPVAIAWEPLGSDVFYSYSIVRTVCQPFGFKEAVAGDRTTASRVVLDLPPNKEGEFYTLRFEAQKNNKTVGSLMTHGANGWGWDYRFRVLPRRGPTRVISPIKK